MPDRRVYRLVLGLIVVLSLLTLAHGHRTAALERPSDGSPAASAIVSTGRQQVEARVAPPRENITVITTDSNVWLADDGDGPRARAEIVALRPNGSVLYYNDSHTRYWDVDPSPAGRTTVLYVAADHLNRSECVARTVCTRNVVERVNLTTGEVTRLYSQVTPHKHSTRWHDVDRIDDARLLVADIYRDRVFIVNTTTGLVEWAWEAQSEFPPASGGPYPRDWTHLNDVEHLDDGRIMASLRNQDQVVFLDRRRGLLSEWTLGADDEHDVLYEQHNPDYIPEQNGGPAVLVSDSENNRVVEYQRVDGEWKRTWAWQDPALQWPRDADRLPNGNTLVTDSNGDRVVEIDPGGEVVWSVDIGFPYEAERLGTGDESAGGRSAASLGLESRTGTGGSESHGKSADVTAVVWTRIKALVPGPVLNSVVYALPGWVGFREVLAAVALVLAAVTWAGLEVRWSPYTVEVGSPVRVSRKR